MHGPQVVNTADATSKRSAFKRRLGIDFGTVNIYDFREHCKNSETTAKALNPIFQCGAVYNKCTEETGRGESSSKSCDSNTTG